MLGTVDLASGVTSGTICVKLPQFPLLNDQESVKLVLEEPSGTLAKLSDKKSCIIDIKHDKGLFKNLLVIIHILFKSSNRRRSYSNAI